MTAESRETERDPSRNGTGAEGSLLSLGPGLARIAATAAWRSTGWAVSTSARASSRVMQAAVTGENPSDLFQATGAELREYGRRFLGLVDDAVGSDLRDREAGGEEPIDPREATPETLRRRGEELLRQSTDVSLAEDLHPAYARILDDLSPDEGRILRLLATGGPQPAVDVRSGIQFLPIGSELHGQGLSLIGSEAGCRHVERVHMYLNNLNRLGLIWFTREPIKDPKRYQVIEAQPEVTDALERAGRLGHTVRRSVHLTPFGADFCEVCLPVETREFESVMAGEPVEPAPVEENGGAPEAAEVPPAEEPLSR